MWQVTLINLALAGAAVFIHYEALSRMSVRFSHSKKRRRSYLMLGVFGALAAHVAEIWLYGVAIYWLIKDGRLGTLSGNTDSSLYDSLYFSISNYTSLGMGDILPEGPIRLVAGFEALIGLVLITWTASFLFLEMQKIWSQSE